MQILNPLVSIILPTVDRYEEVQNFIDSLIRCDYKNVELIIVDQNYDSKISSLLDSYVEKISIAHLRVQFRGASKARNHGAKYAKGEILFFPDDDCELFSNSITLAIKTMQDVRSEVVFGRCVDWDKKDSVINFYRKSGFLTPHKYKGMFIETTLFLSKITFEKFRFDENLGVGCFHGSEEGRDLVLRMMSGGISMFYNYDLVVYHPNKVVGHSMPVEIKRVFTYRCGFAKLCFKHRLYRDYFERLVLVMLYIPWISIYSPKKLRYYISELLGLLVGVVVK
jgi:glycosyltransferase involved in cell wall biosynthesis